ncbi:MAG: N-acetyltransferase family protein [Acidimicrobiia bacterium]
MKIRRASHDDIPSIVSFTTGTFEWGDYVPDAITEWIDDSDGAVMVATIDERPVAVARIVLVTPTEAWGHAVRVDPGFRGRGIAGVLATELADWALDAGAHVVRLLIEQDNDSSIRHVEKVGFRRTVELVRATRSVGEATANPEGNGVGHGPSRLRARPGKRQDVTLVMASWSSSEIGRATRGLIGEGWQFHTMRASDVRNAAAHSSLWEVGNSWAITTETAPIFHVAMLDTRPEDAFATIKALIDAANNRGAELVSIWLPGLDWLVQAARRSGCDTEPFGIWERGL